MADKMKEAFREKVLKIIDEMKKEFDLKLYTTLTIKSNTRELCKAHAEVHGIDISGKIMLCAILQEFSDDILDKVIRYAVYMLAVDCEDKCSRIKGIKACLVAYPDTEVKSTYTADAPEGLKYCLNITHQEYLRIVDEYNAAIKQINEELKKR